MALAESPDLSFDTAIVSRLRKLRHRPLDMTVLERRVRSAIPQRNSVEASRVWWRTPLRAIAASLVIVAAVVAAVLTTHPRPVLASPVDLSRIHRISTTSASPAGEANGIRSANEALAAQWPDCPRVPEIPAAVVMGCQTHLLGGKRLGSVALTLDGRPVTLVVAPAADIQTARSRSVTRGGTDYFIQSSGSLNMISAKYAGVWFCLIGELPAERLVDVAATLQH